MTVRPEAELQAALVNARNLYSAAEAEFQEQRFLTDDEVRSFMREQASVEKASIRKAVDEGRVFVFAGSGVRRVHTYSCSSLVQQIDRDRAWSIWQSGDPEEFRLAVAHGDGGPRMPRLLDRAAVEALSTYVTCQICSPTLTRMRKSRGERTTKLRSLAARHLGRSLIGLDGVPLGQLVRIITTVDAQGSLVQVETTTQSLSEADHPAVLVVPAGV